MSEEMQDQSVAAYDGERKKDLLFIKRRQILDGIPEETVGLGNQ